jgi:hypothetical protein
VGALDQIRFCRIFEIAFSARTKLAGLASLFRLPSEPLFGFLLTDGAIDPLPTLGGAGTAIETDGSCR